MLAPVVTRAEGSSFRREGETSIQVERGTVFAFSVGPAGQAEAADRLGPWIERILSAGLSGNPGIFTILDAAGHRRPVNRPLLIYCCLQAYRLFYEVLPRTEFGRWEEGLRPWCDLLEAELTSIDL